MNKSFDFSGWEKKFDEIVKSKDEIVNDINDYLLNYFKSSFDTKSFNNVRWKPSNNNNNTLIESGDLKRSIKTVSKSFAQIHIQSDTPYSAIHNYGGRIRITDKMRKFFWAKFYETKNTMWKGMALTNRTYITIPQREFIGVPMSLQRDIEQILKKYIK